MQLLCPECSYVAKNKRDLGLHRSQKHKVANPVRRFVGDVTVCRVCMIKYGNRTKLIRHLSERPKAGPNGSHESRCFTLLKSFQEVLPEQVTDELDSIDQHNLTLANRTGSSNSTSYIMADEVAARVPGPLRRFWFDGPEGSRVWASVHSGRKFRTWPAAQGAMG